MKHTITVTVYDEHYDDSAFQMVHTAMRNIARNLLPGAVVTIERGEMGEPIRGVNPGGDRVGGDNWWSLPVFRQHHDGSSGEGEAVVRDSVRSHRRFRDSRGSGIERGPSAPRGPVAPKGPAAPRGPAASKGPESGSDRLTGALRGTLVSITAREDQIVKVGSHRGRRRRLLDLLKKAGAGRRFRR